MWAPAAAVTASDASEGGFGGGALFIHPRHGRFPPRDTPALCCPHRQPAAQLIDLSCVSPCTRCPASLNICTAAITKVVGISWMSNSSISVSYSNASFIKWINYFLKGLIYSFKPPPTELGLYLGVAQFKSNDFIHIYKVSVKFDVIVFLLKIQPIITAQ